MKVDKPSGQTDMVYTRVTITRSNRVKIIAISETSVDCEGDKMTLNLVESETFEKIHLLEKGGGML